MSALEFHLGPGITVQPGLLSVDPLPSFLAAHVLATIFNSTACSPETSFPILVKARLLLLPLLAFSYFIAPQTPAEGLQKKSNKEAEVLSSADEFHSRGDLQSMVK